MNKVINVDGDLVRSFQAMLSQVYSTCVALSYLGEVTITKSINVDANLKLDEDQLKKLIVAKKIPDLLASPIFWNNRQIILPVGIYKKKLITKASIIEVGDRNLDVRSSVESIIQLLDLLGMNHPDFSRFLMTKRSWFRWMRRK